MLDILIHVGCLIKELYLSVYEAFSGYITQLVIYFYVLGILFLVLDNDCFIIWWAVVTCEYILFVVTQNGSAIHFLTFALKIQRTKAQSFGAHSIIKFPRPFNKCVLPMK